MRGFMHCTIQHLRGGVVDILSMSNPALKLVEKMQRIMFVPSHHRIQQSLGMIAYILSSRSPLKFRLSLGASGGFQLRSMELVPGERRFSYLSIFA